MEREKNLLVNRLKAWRKKAETPDLRYGQHAPDVVKAIEEIIREEWPDEAEELLR